MKTILNVKVDREIKKQAQELAGNLGIPLSFVVNAHLRRFINEREIYIGAPLKPTKKLAARLKKIDADIKAGRNLSPAFSSIEEMDNYLNRL